MRSLVNVALVVGVLCLCPIASAQEMPVPPQLQAALFKKIFDYDRTLSEQSSVRVAVVHGGDDAVAVMVANAFQNDGVDAVVVSRDDVTEEITEASVVYMTPGFDTGALAALCTQYGVLSVSGVPELAVSGQVAVGIGTRDQKPEILVHLKRVKAEGHEFSAELLSLARVIR